IQKREFGREPGQLIEENQAAHKQKQGPAENLHSMEILSKILIKSHELADPQSCQQKGDGQARGIHRKQENASRDRMAGCGERENRGKNRPDAGSPPEGERKTQQEAAPDARLRDIAAKVHIAVEPARQGGTEESNQRERKEVHRLESRKERTLTQQRCDSKACENHAQNNA